MSTAIGQGWSWETGVAGQTLQLDAIATTVVVGALVVTSTVLIGRKTQQSAGPGPIAVVVRSSLSTLGRYVTAGPHWARRRIETLAFTLFWFILLSHWLHLIPALRVHAPTSDINVTLALAGVTLMVVHATAAQATGWRTHLRHFTRPGYLLPLRVLEVLARTVSMSLRLFGVLFASIVIVEVINEVLPPPATVVPLALWTAFDLVMAVVQAYIFALLACTYYNLAMPETVSPKGMDGSASTAEPSTDLRTASRLPLSATATAIEGAR
jgi:F-type H+-transporting ATPase subunit a